MTETPKGAKTFEQVDNAEDQQVSQPQVPIQQARPSCNVVTPSRYCAIASLDEAAIDEEVRRTCNSYFTTRRKSLKSLLNLHSSDPYSTVPCKKKLDFLPFMK